MKDFQQSVRDWLEKAFGLNSASYSHAENRTERVHRFIEESIELAQAAGVSREEVLQLVDYTYGRPVGELEQEIGGASVTLAAVCVGYQLDWNELAWREIIRCWDNIDKIRAKQAVKPKVGPLPGPSGPRRVRHKKRGSFYEVVHTGVELQCSSTTSIREGTRLTVYRGSDGRLWARWEQEFEDGRFEAVS